MITSGPYKPDSYRRGNHTLRGSKGVITPRPALVIPREQRQLVMSRAVMEDYADCRLTMHAIEKHEANPLISNDPSMGLDQQMMASTVLYDDEIGRFRMWGTALNNDKPSNAPDFICSKYAESSDGFNWVQPSLGQFCFNGSRDNSIMSYEMSGHGPLQTRNPQVFRIPESHGELGRFGMVVAAIRMEAAEDDHKMEQHLAFSDDGCVWKLREDHNPFIRGRNDTPSQTIVWNEQRQVFMHYRRMTVNAQEIRRIAYTQSADLVHWTQPRLIIGPDELDPPMFYGMSVTRYQNMYLGELHNFYATGQSDTWTHKSQHVDVQLAWSHDGANWERHPQRPIFIPLGAMRGGSPDWGMVWGVSDMMDVGEKVFVYYRAEETLHTRLVPHHGYHVCLGTLRRDGFVSLDAQQQGWAMTVPLRCPGGKLHINARTASDGLVQVAVREGEGIRDGEWPEAWSFDAATDFTGDAIDHEVNWKGQADLSPWQGRTIRLEFRLFKGELYSFWFE